MCIVNFFFILLPPQNAESLLKEVLGETYERAVPEISVYLVEGVGNSTRIDYGTGKHYKQALYILFFFKRIFEKKERKMALLFKDTNNIQWTLLTRTSNIQAKWFL